jgi:flagellar biosynthetic protein FlhB
MGGDDDDNEKSHQPSQKKLDDARVKGDVPRSADLTTASTYGGLLIAFLALGTTSLSNTFSIFSYMLDKSDVLALVWFSESSRQIIRSMTSQLILALSIWFFVPMCAALISIIIQRSFIIAPDKILLKFSRISIISNGKNKFGRSGLFDFLKSTLKLSLYSLILGVLLYARLPEIISTIQMPPISVLYVFLKISIEFLTIVFIIAIFIGCLDFLWQYNEHIRQNRMSYKEMLDEHKQMEGDPHVKY